MFADPLLSILVEPAKELCAKGRDRLQWLAQKTRCLAPAGEYLSYSETEAVT